jgi:hypothetical protein
MGCRCNERQQAIGRASVAFVQGRIVDATREIGFVGRTLAADVRSGDLRRAATQQLARMRLVKRA